MTFNLPPLIEAPCPHCDGEGGHEYATPSPESILVRCEGCAGKAVIYVCPSCGEEPFVWQGLELCSCNAHAVRLAA